LKTKAPFPLAQYAGQDLSPLVEAYFEINQLKHLYRQGWLRRGVPTEKCETVAEHVFGMVMLAWWMTDQYFPSLDRDRVVCLVLVHELGEVYTGDLTPADGIAVHEKHRLEREAVQRVTAKLARGEHYLKLWDEYEAALTPEARLVKQIDRLEMAFQARVYESQGRGNMYEFFESAAGALVEPILREILQELRDLRPPGVTNPTL
jgi:putative hydrolases of HD superfamily